MWNANDLTLLHIHIITGLENCCLFMSNSCWTRNSLVLYLYFNIQQLANKKENNNKNNNTNSYYNLYFITSPTF